MDRWWCGDVKPAERSRLRVVIVRSFHTARCLGADAIERRKGRLVVPFRRNQDVPFTARSVNRRRRNFMFKPCPFLAELWLRLTGPASIPTVC
jgi:hypothetical protein